MNHLSAGEKADYARLRNRYIGLWALVVAIYGGLIGLVYAAFFPNQPVIFYIFLGLLCFLLLFFLILGTIPFVIGKRNIDDIGEKRYEAYLKRSLACVKFSKGKNQEVYQGNVASAYLLLDRLPEAKEAYSHVHNLLLADAFLAIRVLLLLSDKRYEEAKAAYLSYALHHRNGRMYGERQTTLAMDALFHHLEGTAVSEEEMKAAQEEPYPLFQRLFAEPSNIPTAAASAPTVNEAVKQDSALLLEAREKQDALNGAGNHRLQLPLNLLFFFSLFGFFAFLLWGIIGSENALKADPTLNDFSQLWVMFFALAIALASIVLAYMAKHKEPKDHVIKNLVAGYLVAALSLMTALTAFLGNSARHDYSYARAAGEEAGLSLPAEGKMRQDIESNGEIVTISLLVFTNEKTYAPFLTAIGSAPWVDEAAVDSFLYLQDYTSPSHELYEGDRFYVYNRDEKTVNQKPSVSGTYHFYEFAHLPSLPWLVLVSYQMKVTIA